MKTALVTIVSSILSSLLVGIIVFNHAYEQGKLNGVIESSFLHSSTYKLDMILAEQRDFERIEKSNRDMMYSMVLEFADWRTVDGVSEENKNRISVYIDSVAEYHFENPGKFLSEPKAEIFKKNYYDEIERLREIFNESKAQPVAVDNSAR